MAADRAHDDLAVLECECAQRRQPDEQPPQLRRAQRGHADSPQPGIRGHDRVAACHEQLAGARGVAQPLEDLGKAGVAEVALVGFDVPLEVVEEEQQRYLREHPAGDVELGRLVDLGIHERAANVRELFDAIERRDDRGRQLRGIPATFMDGGQPTPFHQATLDAPGERGLADPADAGQDDPRDVAEALSRLGTAAQRAQRLAQLLATADQLADAQAPDGPTGRCLRRVLERLGRRAGAHQREVVAGGQERCDAVLGKHLRAGDGCVGSRQLDRPPRARQRRARVRAPRRGERVVEPPGEQRRVRVGHRCLHREHAIDAGRDESCREACGSLLRAGAARQNDERQRPARRAHALDELCGFDRHRLAVLVLELESTR